MAVLFYSCEFTCVLTGPDQNYCKSPERFGEVVRDHVPQNSVAKLEVKRQMG